MFDDHRCGSALGRSHRGARGTGTLGPHPCDGAPAARSGRNNHNPTWSPEGNKIVFTHSDSAQFSPEQIYMMNPDRTGITRVTPFKDNSFAPDWGSG